MAPGDLDDVMLGKVLSQTSKPSLDELQQRHNALLDALVQPCWLLRDGFCIEANRAAKDLLRDHASAGLGRFLDLVSIADRQRVADQLAAVVTELGRTAKIHFCLGLSPSRVVELEAKAVAVRVAGSPAIQLVANLGLRQAAKADATVAYSLRDPVTGLPSKMLFREELDRACRRSRRFGTRVLLVRIDVAPRTFDGDQPDPKTLDRLAIALDAALSSTVRETDYVGRLGPLAFAVLGIDVAQMQDVTRLGERVAAAVGTSVMIDGAEWFWHMRMGGTIYPDDHAQPDMLITHAETALMTTAAAVGNELRLHHSVALDAYNPAELLVDFAAE